MRELFVGGEKSEDFLHYEEFFPFKLKDLKFDVKLLLLLIAILISICFLC